MRGSGMVTTGVGLSRDGYQGYQMGDYSGLVSDGVLMSGFPLNPVVGAAIMVAATELRRWH